MDPTTIATVQEWFANAYGEESARVLCSISRTSGGLFKIAHGHRTSWLRVGGVLRRSAAEVEAEGRVATALVENGINVAAPLRRAGGTFAGSIVLAGESVPAIAYGHVEGEQVETPTPEQAIRFGEVVGALQGSRIDAGGLPIVEPMATITECIVAAAEWLDAEDELWLRSTVDQQSAALQRAEPSARETICHGDVYLANARFAGDVPTLLDLENLGIGPPIYDCACMWRKRVLDNDFSVPTDWRFFKRGYERTTQMDEEHWRLLPALAVLRQVWTMSLPALPGSTWGEDSVRDPDYWRAQLRMVRWFADFAAKVQLGTSATKLTGNMRGA